MTDDPRRLLPLPAARPRRGGWGRLLGLRLGGRPSQRPGSLLLRPDQGDVIQQDIQQERGPVLVVGIAAQLDDPALVILARDGLPVLERADVTGVALEDLLLNVLPVALEIGGVTAADRLNVEQEQVVDASAERADEPRLGLAPAPLLPGLEGLPSVQNPPLPLIPELPFRPLLRPGAAGEDLQEGRVVDRFGPGDRLVEELAQLQPVHLLLLAGD